MTNQVNKYPEFNTFNDTWSLWIWGWVLYRFLKPQSLSTTALFNMCSPGQSYSTHFCNSSKKICFERRSKSLFRKLLLACTFNLHALLFAKMSMKTLRLRRFYDIVHFLKDLLPTSFPGSCPTRSPWRERERGGACCWWVLFVKYILFYIFIHCLQICGFLAFSRKYNFALIVSRLGTCSKVPYWLVFM